MADDVRDEVRDRWNRLAREWAVQVGDEGDSNRRLNSDPVLWQFVGDVAGRDVLDAGCGTGYLSAMLAGRGARVTGVDVSEEMIAIARSSHPGIPFRRDSIAELATVDDRSQDLIVSNYVLMDCEDLEGAVRSFHRVLRERGEAVLVFSHPCFPQGRTEVSRRGETTYVWGFPYFEPSRHIDPPWAHFTTPFLWFHRPLSDYWKAFVRAGFAVLDFEEPRITPDRYALAESPKQLESCRTRPYSVAFKLGKGTA